MDSFEGLKELILYYLRALWRHRWISIFIAWGVMLAGIMLVDQIKDRYRSETKIYIDTSSMLTPLLRGMAIQSDFESNVRLMVKKLLSRPNLERAVRLMDMDVNAKNERQLEQLIQKIRDRTEVGSVARSGSYTIAYSDENAATAKRMVQTLLDIFVEDTLGKGLKESDSAISFLDKQIEKYDGMLADAEKRVEEFKRENVGLMPQDGRSYYQQLQQTITSLEDAKQELAEATQRRDKLKSQYREIGNAEQSQSFLSGYDERISKLQGLLDDQLLQYTEAHPDIVNTRRNIAALEKKREAEFIQFKQDQKKDGSINLGGNPAYQQLHLLLTETEAEVASLQSRVQSYIAKEAKLKQVVDIVPKVEAELARLNRDYEVHKKNYTELVARREQAQLSEDVESGTEQVKFRIIEPPNLPLKANFPNRPLFDLGVLVLALGVGYGMGILLSLMQPVFYTAAELHKFTLLPVLGGVRKMETETVLTKRKIHRTLFFIANVLLVVVSAGLIYLHSKGVLILSNVQQILVGLSG